jgi:hypothetical protein
VLGGLGLMYEGRSNLLPIYIHLTFNLIKQSFYLSNSFLCSFLFPS